MFGQKVSPTQSHLNLKSQAPLRPPLFCFHSQHPTGGQSTNDTLSAKPINIFKSSPCSPGGIWPAYLPLPLKTLPSVSLWTSTLFFLLLLSFLLTSHCQFFFLFLIFTLQRASWPLLCIFFLHDSSYFLSFRHYIVTSQIRIEVFWASYLYS